MPIICSGVNRASQEKLVPITRQNSDSIVPDKTVITLELAVVSPENGPFWEQWMKISLYSFLNYYLRQLSTG
jgi:hypothetical protein